MKNLKLLNKNNLSILLILIFFQKVYSAEPVDIWNLEKKSNEKITVNNEMGGTEAENESLNSIYKIELGNTMEPTINEEKNILSKKINIIGIYDPSDNDLSINMWKNSNGKKILEIVDKINKINLSQDAINILNIAYLTNSYLPEKNITREQFIKIKSDWLIKQKNLDLIKNYLMKNIGLENNSDLIKYYIDYYLSRSDLSKSCELLNDIKYLNDDDYISKFKIYCLINSKKDEEAQLQFDLLKENGFNDTFYEQKFSYLIGYDQNISNEISEESLLNFHLSHRTNPEFKFEPKINTSKIIWKYLSSSNLLESIDFIDLEDKEKIFTIEKATHEKNYKEEELFALYERFMFNINQLLTVNETYKLLPNSEARALLYQGILLKNDVPEKIKLIKLLKDSFEQDGITNAFDTKLVKFLNKIEQKEVPSNYTNFYQLHLKKNESNNKKIKFNNKIIHQSKLLNYFKEDSNQNNIDEDLENLLKKIKKDNIDKDLENLLKKIKKDKKYFFSTKDIILLESLKSDGIQIPKKYENIYESTEATIPYDIQILINKKEQGLALLRLAEIIGEDQIIDIGSETLYFIISTLNQLNIDRIRNKILLQVLPLKV